MKKHSSVLVLILIITLAFSAFSIMSNAYSVTADNYADVLEFYESYEYVNEPFDGDSLFSDSSAEFTQNGSFASGSFSNGVYSATNLSRVALTVAPRDADARKYNSLGFNFGFAFTDATGKLSLEIADAMNNKISIFRFEDTQIKHQDVEVELDYEDPTANKAIYEMQTDADYTLAKNSFYDVSVFITFVNETETLIDITVSDRNATPAVVTYTTSVYNFDFESISLVSNSSATGRITKFDYVEAYEGSFSHRLNDIDTIVGEYINAMITAHKANPASAFEQDILEAIAKVIIDYGYTTTDSSVLASIEYCALNLGNRYAVEYVDLSKQITEESTYTERLDMLATSKVLYKIIKYTEDNYSYVDENDGTTKNSIIDKFQVFYSDILTAKEKFDEQEILLPLIKEDMSFYIDTVADKEIYSMTYVELEAIYNEIVDIEICPSFHDDVYSERDVKSALDIGKAIVEEFERLYDNARIFVESIYILKDPYRYSFAERYFAYVSATENYFTDSSYDVYLEDLGITIEELIRQYNIFADGMAVTSEYAEEFLMKMRSASETANFTVKVNALDAVVGYIDYVEKGYPGVADAINDYNEMRAYITSKIESCREFIKAVQAIDEAQTLADRKTAVAAALALAAEGRDSTVVEPVNGEYVTVTYNGWRVTDAAIKLAEADSAIKTLENKAQNFINAVDAISSARNTADRRAAINYAVSLESLADATLDSVKQASSKLDAEIASFNSDVDSANSFQNDTAELSVAVSALAKGDADSAEVVAIIKKFYE